MTGHSPHPVWRNCWRVLSHVLYAGLRAGTPFDDKLRAAISGRRGEQWSNFPKQAIVFHCASVGEFEAARPVIEQIQTKYPVALTVGSPSLYRRYTGTSQHSFPWYWAPLDIPREVRRFLDAAQPRLIVITKHDIWPELVWQSRERGIPVLLQSGNFRTDSKRTIAIVRSFQKSLLGALAGIGAIGKEEADRFHLLIGNRTDIRVTGDTRYDRVLAAASRADMRDPALREWMDAQPTIVLGSGWQPDEELLFPALQKLREEGISFRVVAVPHETGEEHIDATEQRLTANGFRVARYSTSLSQLSQSDALLVDVQGILAAIYRGAKIAWVGGGFGAGIHSVLEPAVYGIPLLFGPNITMSREARLLAEAGSGIVCDREDDKWISILRNWFLEESSRTKAGTIGRQLIEHESGATKRTVAWIEELLRNG